MWFLRKTRNLSVLEIGERIEALSVEFADDPTPVELSVYRIDDESDPLRVATLYNASRPARSNPFDFVRIEMDVASAFAESVDQTDGESPFRWLRERHYVLRNVEDCTGLASTVAGSATRFAPKKVREAILEERTALSVSTEAEWNETPPWTRE